MLAPFVNQPQLVEHIHWFLYNQYHPDAEVCSMDTPLHLCPIVSSNLHIKVYHSATSTYDTPSDLLGVGGMHCKIICMTPSWKKGLGQYDCVYIENNAELEGFSGLLVAHVNLFFSFSFEGTTYPCALVQWFSTYSDSPCKDAGFWRVEPDHNARGGHQCSVIYTLIPFSNQHILSEWQVPSSFLRHLHTTIPFTHSNYFM